MSLKSPGRVAPFPDMQYIFLDRDGVINRKAPAGAYVSKWEDFHLLSGVELAIATLNRAGKRVVIVSNQRGVALGLYSLSDVDKLHKRLQEHLATFNAHIDAFYICPHDKGQCNCRKPRTGLLEQAFRDFPEATTANSILIGDSLSDIQTARNFGIPSIFITNIPHAAYAHFEDGQWSAPGTAISLEEAIRKCFT